MRFLSILRLPAMKISLLLSVVALVHQTTCSSSPELGANLDIVEDGKLHGTIVTATTSSSTTATPTTSVATLGPSPTSWASWGCYHQDDHLIMFQMNRSPMGGDSNLTVSKCLNTCYLESCIYAGLGEGSECWCAKYVVGVEALDQTDCNLLCTGDKSSFCGGKGFVNVFKAESMETTSITTSSSTASSTTTSSSLAETVLNATPSSGAMRNMAMFMHFI
ncbi:hypothetical protein V495_03787 [Pseudogymnoascus sp. VKM F-4514 (FW-929)]|nr:hypothetical protein V495_03787 [Pseudogymnoascus sp. VKM F-4514 (FW-929)]KFY54736.1 hypothetical protein V497_07514 [Pseudogymnoascus sp. VKM F-4516 (FW-969)]